MKHQIHPDDIADAEVLDFLAHAARNPAASAATRLVPACRWVLHPRTGRPVRAWSMQPRSTRTVADRS
jgi:hypothetical protein